MYTKQLGISQISFIVFQNVRLHPQFIFPLKGTSFQRTYSTQKLVLQERNNLLR